MSADIALVSPYPSERDPGSSGVAWYSQSLARALADAGAEVTVLAPGHVPAGGVPDHDGPVRVDRRFGRGPRAALAALAAAGDTGAPVVHVQHEAFLYGGPASVPAVLAGLAGLRRAGRGPVVTMHQVVDPRSVDHRFTDMHRVSIPPVAARASLRGMQTAISRTASRVIVHEEAFRRTIPGAVVFPLGGGSTPAGGPAVAARAAALRAEAGVPDGGLLALCFGFVAPYKGVELALEAARLAGPEVRLVVAGGEHPRLAGQGYLDGLRDRYGPVAAFTGYIDDADVSPWFLAADVVLLPYPQPFSSSGVLAHAVSHRVPTLVSSALAEVIGFPPEAALPPDPVGVAARLADLAGDRRGLAELAALTAGTGAGRSWPELAERHLGLYEEVVHAQRRAHRLPRRRPRR